MTSSDENCLIMRQSPNVNKLGGSGDASREILKFKSSEIGEISYSSVYFQEILAKN